MRDKATVGAFSPALDEKLLRYTARPCTRTSDARPRSVILVPPASDLAIGFDVAKAKLRAGQPVRLVGNGVAFPREWPSWVIDVPGLWLTELSAYRSKTRWEATRPLRESLKALADELFASALPDLRGSEVFYPYIGQRAFTSLTTFMPMAVGLAEHHGQDTVECTEPDWSGFALYNALIGRRPTSSRGVRWSGRVAALACAGWAASSLRLLETFWRSRVGLAELRHRPPRRRPGIWLHLDPDWPRINGALIQATRDRQVGVLLHGNIGRGEVDEAQLTRRFGRELWPGLRDIDRSRVEAWETTSIPPTFALFGQSWLQFTGGCALATARLCRRGPWLEMGKVRLDITASGYDLAKLLTIDLGRVCMADLATANVLRRHDVRDVTVVFGGAVLPDTAVVVRRFRQSGANTIDFAHGWSGEPMPYAMEPPSNYRCVWASTDVADNEVRFLVGGMSVPPRLARLPRSSKPRVLLMSSYAHRDDLLERYGFKPYQDELLEVIRSRSDRYSFRWRPHPADQPAVVSLAAKGLPAELSQGRPLAEDLAWADVVVSSMSTAVVQALLLDLPVLVHITPDLDGSPQASPFAAQRTFFFAKEGTEKLDAMVTTLGDPDLLAPERCARTILFGETREPRSLMEAVASVAPGEVVKWTRAESETQTSP